MNDVITILHVDDDEDIREITKLSLSLEPGFKLHQCASGSEAIESALKINPDVFLLDMVMPGMDGQETWKRLKNDVGMHDTPAIFMSARAEEDFAKQLMAQGAAGVITKPFDPMTLGQQIKDVLVVGRNPASGPRNTGSGDVLPFET